MNTATASTTQDRPARAGSQPPPPAAGPVVDPRPSLAKRFGRGRAATAVKVPKTPRAGSTRAGLRGFRRRDGGWATVVEVPPEFRGTTAAVAGFWPFAAGAESPMIGVPLGPNLLTGATVCADPINWFERAHLISNPSAFVLGRPGLGKSTLVRRIVLGMAAQGVTPLILGDLKPDYTALVEAIGGPVIRFGRGNQLNILDPGGMTAAADTTHPGREWALMMNPETFVMIDPPETTIAAPTPGYLPRRAPVFAGVEVCEDQQHERAVEECG